MRHTVLKPLRHSRQRYAPGDRVDLTVQQAAPLVALLVIGAGVPELVPVAENPEGGAAPAALTAAQKAVRPARTSAPKAVEPPKAGG